MSARNILKFCSEYESMAYVIDGVARSGYFYTLTARTGTGKTSFNIVTALAVATGRADILGREVERGRVAYFAFENPDDARMRFLAAAYRWGICISDIADQIEVFDVKQRPPAPDHQPPAGGSGHRPGRLLRARLERELCRRRPGPFGPLGRI